MEFRVGVGEWNFYPSALELITRTHDLNFFRSRTRNSNFFQKKLRGLRELGVSYNEDVEVKELGTWWKCV